MFETACPRRWEYRYPVQTQTKDKVLRCALKVLAAASELIYSLQNVPCWTSADGSVSPIDALESNHLVNATAILIRETRHGQKRILPFMRAECEKRGLLDYAELRAKKWRS